MSHPHTEMEMLRQRAAWAEGELARIERETAQAAIARREEIRVEEENKQREEREVQETAELEEHRVNCWVNHRIEAALASENREAAFAPLFEQGPKANIPSGWPPGRDPSEFRHVVAGTPALRDEKVATTRLGQALASKGVTI